MQADWDVIGEPFGIGAKDQSATIDEEKQRMQADWDVTV